jgi:PAS domain S-box-containing protein
MIHDIIMTFRYACEVGLLNGVERLIYISLLAVLGIALIIAIRTRHKKAVAQSTGSSLSLIVETMREGYLGLDAKGRILDVNNSYLAMTGYRKSDLIGLQIARIAVHESQEKLFARLNAITHDQPAYYRSEHRAKDGSIIPMEVAVTATREGQLSFICIYRDLREQERAEHEVRHSIDLLRYVVEHTWSAVAIFDRFMRYQFVSEKYRQEFHLEAQAPIVGLCHYEVLPDIPERWKEIHRRVLAGEVLSCQDDIFERSDGSIEYNRWECRPWYESDDSIGGVVLYTENITAQKQFEQELLAARDYLSALITRANAPIIVWDEEFTIVRTNPAFDSLFSMEADQLIRQKIGILKRFIDSGVDEKIAALFLNHQRIEMLETGITQTDGSVKTVLWTAAPVFDPASKKLQVFIGQGQEISERKRIEAENQEQLETLQRWYAVMSHREERVMELKREVNDLLREAGRPVRYASVEGRAES